jgi:ribosomal protein S18 acetylase RimI-like enzyme
MTEYTAVRARADDTDAVHALLAAAGRHLAARGFRNWEPPYPRERVATDVAEGVVFVVRGPGPGAGGPLATYALRGAPGRPYVPAPWADPAAPACYLSRLAVTPDAQGQGVGAWCLRRVAAQAVAAGARAVRCDVLAANAGLRSFYERAGYRARGTRVHSGWEFACYERLLAGPAGAPDA